MIWVGLSTNCAFAKGSNVKGSHFLGIIFFVGLLVCSHTAFANGTTEIPNVGTQPKWVIAIHGGAGGASRANLSEEKKSAIRRDLQAALQAGAKVLEAGGQGTLAITASLSVLENSPLFNAGRGAALDEYGRAIHDASIMRGENLSAGAVAGSSKIKNPILAAHAVMEQTDNVLLHGEGADWFALNLGLEMVNPLYFVTEDRRKALLDKQGTPWGTVGAVVIDQYGNLAAGTSTGGRTNKRFGRVGDSPIIGAGTYASNSSCAVSATGHGEFFMRWTVARDICARMEFGGESLEQAAQNMLINKLLPVGGLGAVVAIDPAGKVVFVSTTANLKRGVMSSDTSPQVAVYSDEQMK